MEVAQIDKLAEEAKGVHILVCPATVVNQCEQCNDKGEQHHGKRHDGERHACRAREMKQR